MNSKTLFHDLVSRITLDESPGEIHSILYLLLEKQSGLTKADIIAEKPVEITPLSKDVLISSIDRLNQHEPIQYILGECEFYGRKFQITPAVLIPRPETEELIRTILHYYRNKKKSLRILDIGTGSGCIPVTLALELKGSTVFATDISRGALELARKNAEKSAAVVQFYEHNILSEDIPLQELDLIVSNPPYITQQEKESMKDNVLQYEPHLALFVPENDPLIFYGTILARGRKALNPGGMIIVEINERYGDAVVKLFREHNFSSATIGKDISGKERIAYGFMLLPG